MPYCTVLFDGLSRVLGYAPSSYKTKFQTRCFTLIVRRLENIGDDEIRVVDPRVITSFMRHLVVYGYKNVHKHYETQELLLAAKLLASPTFERRIQGIIELTRIKDKVLRAHWRQEGDWAKTQEGKEESKWLKLQGFISFLDKYQLLQNIFASCQHPEMIRRSYELLKLLADQGKLSKELIALVWNNSMNKHEEII